MGGARVRVRVRIRVSVRVRVRKDGRMKRCPDFFPSQSSFTSFTRRKNNPLRDSPLLGQPHSTGCIRGREREEKGRGGGRAQRKMLFCNKKQNERL